MLPFVKLVDKFEAFYGVVANDDTRFTILTNKDAPRYKLSRVDVDDPQSWTDVLPEHDKAVLESACAVHGDKLLVNYLSDVKYVLQMRSLVTGELLHGIPIDIGSVNGITGRRADSEVFIEFSSFLTPGIIYRCDLSSGTPEMNIYREISVPGFDRTDFEANQVVHSFILYLKNKDVYAWTMRSSVFAIRLTLLGWFSRCFTRARTEPRSRCSWCRGRTWSSTGRTRPCSSATEGSA